MKSLVRRLSAAPIRWQIAALLIVTQVFAHFLTLNLMAGILGLNGTNRGSFAVESVSSFTTVLGLAGQFSGIERDAIIDATVAQDPRFRISTVFPFQGSKASSSLEQEYILALRDAIPSQWGNPVYGYLTSDTPSFYPIGQTLGAVTSLGNGSWLIFTQDSRSTWQLVPLFVLFLAIIVLALPLTFLAIWSGSILLAPLKSLAEGAQRFGDDLDARSIEVRGALEIQRAASAMNLMQARIKSLVDERAHALAAIAHDIRTPLTRLRLRAEALEEIDIKDAILNDLSLMDKMVHSALYFLRNKKRSLEKVPVDISSLAQSIAYEFKDQGKNAAFFGPEKLVAWCEPDLLRRALENLANNAIANSESVLLSVGQAAAGSVFLSVSDDGPGIRESDRASVLNPFVKGEKARSGSGPGSGFGLGLAITENIASAHGGTLTLTDNVPSGLVATITFPVGGKHKALGDATVGEHA